jgi:hypothetical protein
MSSNNLISLNVVVYHKDCLDGLAAAYVANHALKKEQGNNNSNSSTINIPVGHVNKDDKLEFIHNNINLKIKEKVEELKRYTLASRVSVAIYVVDYSFSKTECQYICGFISRECEANSHITILDHHVSAFDDWREAQSQDNIIKKSCPKFKIGEFNNYIFSISKSKFKEQVSVYFNNYYSGAFLSYVYFMHLRKNNSVTVTANVFNYQFLHYLPNDKHDIDVANKFDVPMFIRYIQDRDLWLWNYKETKAFCHYCFQNVKTIEDMAHHFPIVDYDNPTFVEKNKVINQTTVKQFVDMGTLMLDSIEKQMDEIQEKGLQEIVVINEYNNAKYFGYCINANSIFSSELGSRLCRLDKKHGFAIIWSVVTTTDGQPQIACSVRSHDFEFGSDGISKLFGGGGHKNAAGFKLPLDKLNELISGKLVV